MMFMYLKKEFVIIARHDKYDNPQDQLSPNVSPCPDSVDCKPTYKPTRQRRQYLIFNVYPSLRDYHD